MNIRGQTLVCFFFHAIIELVWEVIVERSEILDKIENIVMSNHYSSEYGKELAKLWTEYYQMIYPKHIFSTRANTLTLLGENYLITDSNIERKKVDNNLVKAISTDLKHVLEDRQSGINRGISMEKAKVLLDWSLTNTWRGIRQLGIDVQQNSLNGLGELGQIVSLLPFERLGLTVTKNLVEECFQASCHHSFGSVCFPVEDEETHLVSDTWFLVDSTYKQFFSSSRCHKGMYYRYDEENLEYMKPDPGYFFITQEEQAFTKELITNGYILANEENMKYYGDGFRLACCSLENLEEVKRKLVTMSGKQDIEALLSTATDYSMDQSEVEDYAFTLDLPLTLKKKF